jgi:hypothetical protein
MNQNGLLGQCRMKNSCEFFGTWAQIKPTKLILILNAVVQNYCAIPHAHRHMPVD